MSIRLSLTLEKGRRSDGKRLIGRSDLEVDWNRRRRYRHVQVDSCQKGPAWIDGRAIQRAGVFRFNLADRQSSIGCHFPSAAVLANVQDAHFTTPKDQRGWNAVDVAVDRQRLAGFRLDHRRRLNDPTGRNQHRQNDHSRRFADSVFHLTSVGSGVGQSHAFNLLPQTNSKPTARQKLNDDNKSSHDTSFNASFD